MPACPAKCVLDVGCGGGILSEGMAGAGANVTGIDLSDKALQVAKLHLLESGKQVDYRKIAVEDLAAEQPAHYDVVTCLEMLEHVPDPGSVIAACAKLAKPGGWVFFSTLNRNPKSYLLAVIGAEYILNMLPRGTHDYAKFIKPSELAQSCRNAGLNLADLIGMSYNPLTQSLFIGQGYRRQLHDRLPQGLKVIKAVLFDLDGTFADTAPDLAAALNHTRAMRDLPPLPLRCPAPASVARFARPAHGRFRHRTGASRLRHPARHLSRLLRQQHLRA